MQTDRALRQMLINWFKAIPEDERDEQTSFEKRLMRRLSCLRQAVPRCDDMAAFNYVLPRKNIALHAPTKRGGTKLLVCNTGILQDQQFSELSSLLPPKCHLVINQSKVFRARLSCRRSSDEKESFEAMVSSSCWVNPVRSSP
jgi:hypothetical protein